MKKNITVLILLSFIYSVFILKSFAQVPDTWFEKSNFAGPNRFGSVGFSIGSKGYIGTGIENSKLTDFWEYDPSNDTWSQKASFGGTARVYASGFSIEAKGYIGCGNNDTLTKDFWEFDPATNIWTKKADFGGDPRSAAAAFSIGSKGYMGTGLIDATTRVNDFWEYDPAMDTWTQKSNFGGSTRAYAAGFSIGNKGYIGTGNHPGTLENDFWEYNPEDDTWIKKADFPGAGRFQAIGISTATKGYIGLGDIGGSYDNDFWEYSQAQDSWTKRTNFSGQARILSTGFSIADIVYVGIGYDALNNIKYTDFWEYTPCVPPAITLEPGSQSITYGSTASFIVTTSYQASYQWQEDNGSGFADITDGGIYSNATNDTLTISLPNVNMTDYKYRCIVTGECLYTATSNGNATLTVIAKPLTVTADNKEKCEDGALFEAYSISFDGFLAGEDQSVLGGTLAIGGTAVSAITAGNYSIEPLGLTASDYLINFINGELIIKSTPNAALITRSGDSLLSSVAHGNQWYLDGVEIAGSNDSVYIATSNGTYYTVVTEGGCSSGASNSILILNVSISELSAELFDIYPNPNTGIFNIKINTTGKEEYDIEIYNNLGTLIWKQNNADVDGNNVKKIELSVPVSGVYTVVLRNKADSFAKKLFITR
ncbi:MAG: kelch repeat-containing protein [Bacteroidales bacterium]|nr:kelch repeat-containing protein [Bacteroidales bacterium]